MQMINRFLFLVLCLASLLICSIGVCDQGESKVTTTSETDQSVATHEWEMPTEVLQLQIKYLSVKELTKQADHWLSLLRHTVRKLNETNIEVWYENQQLEAAREAAADSTPAGQESADRRIELESEANDRMLARIADLREQRTQVIDRFNVVLYNLSDKMGLTADGGEQEEILHYRRYIDSVKSLKLDVADTQSTWATIVSWFKSSEGGLKLAKHLGEFLAIIAGFWLFSIVLGKVVGKAMSLSSSTSQLLRRFVTNAARRITIIVGFLLGLAALEINVAPLVAIIGATGFVIAFALQNTLSNFASGLMIMLYKPFDVGDFVQTSEVAGTVKSMTLVTTNVMTPDNKLMVVPNNDLWGKVITNVTHSSERRIDLVFGISYNDDIGLAERVLAEVVAAHPHVLEQPEPVIRVAELADSSVNLICRPWVKTPDYWPTYWELTRNVKERFDAAGISIPFPQRDVHLHTSEAGAAG